MSHAKLLASLGTFLVVAICHTSAFSQTPFWQQTNGPGDRLNLSLSSDRDGNIFATSVDSGLYRSTDRGNNWVSLHVDTTNLSAVFIASSPNGALFAGLFGGGLYRSTDQGTAWSHLTVDIERVFAMAFRHDGTASVGGFYQNDLMDMNARIVHVTDSGMVLDTLLDLLLYTSVTSLLDDSRGNLIAGTFNGILHSSDDGGTWDQINAAPYVWTLCIDSAHEILAGTSRGVFKSTDNGASWQQSGMQNTSIRGLVVNPLGHIFAGAETTGIFRSLDGGQQWTAINSGLADTSVFSLALSPDGYLYAGTNSGIVFRSAQSTTSVQQIGPPLPISYSLGQNYPNPFNPSTSISFSVPKYSYVRFQVFNLLGQLVATIVDQDKQPGSYRVTFDAGDRPSGLYFYRMAAGEFVQTGKAILLR